MPPFHLIGLWYLMSKCIGDGRNNKKCIIAQFWMCDIPLKRPIANHIIVLHLHDEVEQMLFRCQLHRPATNNPFNIRDMDIVTNCITNKGSKTIKSVYLQIIKTLNNVSTPCIRLRTSITLILWLMVFWPPSSNLFDLNRMWMLQATIMIMQTLNMSSSNPCRFHQTLYHVHNLYRKRWKWLWKFINFHSKIVYCLRWP